MEKQELHDLIKSASKGDEAAFLQLYEEKSRSILFRISQIMGGSYDVEDIAQEVVIKMYQSIGKLRSPENFNAWLQSIIMNECYAVMRKKRMFKQMANYNTTNIEDASAYLVEDRMEFLPEDFAEDDEKRKALMEAVQNLPPKRRDAIIMHYYQDMSYAEIASVTKTSVSTVSTNIMRARQTIARELEKKYGSFNMSGFSFALIPVFKLACESSALSAFPDATVAGVFSGAMESLARPHITSSSNKQSSADTAKQIAVTAAGVGIVLAAAISSSRLPNKPTIPPPSSLVSNASAESSRSNSLSRDFFGTLGGHIRFMNNSDEIIEDVGISLSDLDVIMADQDGLIISATKTGGDGSFSFGYQEINTMNNIYIFVDLKQDDYLVGAKVNPKCQILLTENIDLENLNLYVISTRAPDGEITLTSGDCDCGHVNPTEILFTPESSENLEITWEILDNDENVLLFGDGEKSDGASRLFEENADGNYFIRYEVVDRFENSAEFKMNFIIDTNPILENQYS